MSRKEAYGYAAARIRAMECRFLDAAVLGRLLDAEDTASFLKVLGETSYGASSGNQNSDGGFDKILETALIEAYSEVASFVADKELINLLRMQYDFSNIKVLLKSCFNMKSGGKRRYDLLTSLAVYPVDKLITDVESENYLLLPFGLNVTYPKCVAMWEQNKNTLEVERVIDKQMYIEMLKIARKLDIPQIIAWVRTRIDGENLRSLIRLKRFGIESSSAVEFMHDGGQIDTSLLSQMFTESIENWARMIAFADIAPVLEKIDTSSAFAELITDFECVLDNYYYEIAAKSRYNYGDPMNAIAYLWGKEIEVKNLRMLFVSKSGSQDKELVRRLMRHVCA